MTDTTREAVNLTGLDDYLRDPSVGLPWDIRNAALAQVAGAFEAAADLLDAYSEYDQQYCCNGHMCGCRGETVHQMMQHFIRALTPADAKTTLDRLLRQARAEGMREAAKLIPSGWTGEAHVSNMDFGPNVAANARAAILAAADREERGDE